MSFTILSTWATALVVRVIYLSSLKTAPLAPEELKILRRWFIGILISQGYIASEIFLLKYLATAEYEGWLSAIAFIIYFNLVSDFVFTGLLILGRGKSSQFVSIVLLDILLVFILQALS